MLAFLLGEFILTNISIISACNNKCKYCFQQDNYHNLGQMLSYDEILDILDWISDRTKLGIMGGEPTLHPDIVKILEKVSSMNFEKSVIFTNLLCSKKLLFEIVKYTPKIDWLINTTTRDELVDKFEENVEYLSKIIDKKLTFGITLINDLEYDRRNIDKIIRLGKTYPNLVGNYRVSIATPYHKNIVTLDSYDDVVLNFCKTANKETPNIKLRFDCPVNNCQISLKTVAQLIDNYNVDNLKMSHCYPVLDVMADKSVKYCLSMPDDFLTVKHYRDFPDNQACLEYLKEEFFNYIKENSYPCLKNKNCNNTLCNGPCAAITEYIRRQGCSINS